MQVSWECVKTKFLPSLQFVPIVSPKQWQEQPV